MNHARLRAAQHVCEGQGVLALKTLAVLETFFCFVLKSLNFTHEIGIPFLFS